MAHYAYKNVVYDLIPKGFYERYERYFKKNYGREFDPDANYNGDYWFMTESYIQELHSEIKELKEKLRTK